MKKIILLLLFLNINVLAQTGPVVPCVNCEQYSARTEPMNGIWYNPEQSGVGYSIEVQNGIIFGVYYGYDQDAKPTWLTFSGTLVPSDDPEIMWTLDADLTEYEGGTCLNCSYQAPNITDFQSTIHISFKQKNYATLRVNAGESQNIVPLVYGVEATADFAEHSSYKLPDLYGQWSFVFKVNSENYPELSNQWGYHSTIFQIYYKSPPRDLDQDGNLEIRYYVSSYSPPPEIVLNGVIICEMDNQDDILVGPSCVYEYAPGLLAFYGYPIEPSSFHFTLGGLGASRLFGETLDGHTFEAMKIDSTEYQNR